MTLIKLTWDFLRHKKLALLLICVAQLAQVLLSLWLPALNAYIINAGIIPGDIPLIWRAGGIMLGISLIQIACLVGAIYLGARTAMEFGKYLRARVFRQVQSFSVTEQHRFGAPTLITRATNDVTQIQMVVLLSFTVMVMAPLMGLGGIIMAIQQDTKLSLLLVIVVPLLGALVGIVISRLTPRYRIQQKRIDRINTLLREQLTGVRVIRAFVRQSTQRQRFAEANGELREVWLKIGILWAFMMPATSLVVGISAAAVIWFGGYRIEAGAMQVGALTAFISYLMMIMMAVMISGMIIMLLPRGDVSAKRIKEILDVVPAISSPDSPVEIPAGPLTFGLSKVGLQYPGAEAPVLQDIDLVLSPGKTVAIVGSTGSGKSSLVRLFPRLLDATQGEVQVNGVPVPELELADLRSHIALVPQRAFLFSGTVAANVAGTIAGPLSPPADKDGEAAAEYLNEVRLDPATEQRVNRALQAAQAIDFVSDMPYGIYSHVESGGKNLSGGQRQRITIARAIYRCLPGAHQADLLIFDDSFSALDYTTDARLRAKLRNYIGDTAVLVVAQRISTIRDADEIVVLEAGQAIARGTHTELLQTCPTYQEIAASQLSEQEAANEG
ncbi:MAG: ABC transporter ATP-binding protein [Trueperella sp.]|nr:ABC transporter ATP-binding protein [Trueperella sp.]